MYAGETLMLMWSPDTARRAQQRANFMSSFLLLSPETGDRASWTRHPISQILNCTWHVLGMFRSHASKVFQNDMVVTRVIPKLQASNQSHVTLHASVARVQRARSHQITKVIRESFRSHFHSHLNRLSEAQIVLVARFSTVDLVGHDGRSRITRAARKKIIYPLSWW